MRNRLLFLLLVLPALAVVPAFAQTSTKPAYVVDFDPETGVEQERQGDKGLRFTAKFSIIRQSIKADDSAKDYKVVIEEDHVEVRRIDVPAAKVVTEGLSTVLAIDISGKLDRKSGDNNATRRIQQSQKAAEVFLDKLPKKAECGLILFDHDILKGDKVAPTADRAPVQALIKQMHPRGGTAYLNAAKQAIAMLDKMPTDRKKAIILMTDGVDVRSTATLDEVIKLAKKSKVNIYPVGMGEPGKLEPVTSILVIDRSASMEEPADEKDVRSKIVALREAASRFVTMLPKSASTTVLPFGSTVSTAKDFTSDKDALVKEIQALKTEGETKMLDAAFDAISMLAAAKRPGKNAIVVMTDGIDNQSRMRPEDVIARAKSADVTVHMLLFGKEEELVQAMPDMKRIAKETGGTFNHAKNEQALIKIFEDMSIILHDDGIDEKSLQRLAKETGGKYYPAKDIGQLQFITAQITKQLQEKHHSETWTSPTGFDGRKHVITIKLVRVAVGAGGQMVDVEVVQEQTGDRAVRGVVVAEMHPLIYLGVLSVLVLMATVPPTLGKMFRS